MFMEMLQGREIHVDLKITNEIAMSMKIIKTEIVNYTIHVTMFLRLVA